MNILGVEYHDRNHAMFLRHKFPVRYGIIDFGMSLHFEADQAPHLAELYTGRRTMAPEIDLKRPFDPFAADVYQTGSMLLSLLWVRFSYRLYLCYILMHTVLQHLTLLTPEFAPIINSMMRQDNSQRISMAEAHRRFATLNLPPEILYRRIETRFLGIFRHAPQSSEELETFRKHCNTVCNLVD
jgi:hypothetical protein